MKIAVQFFGHLRTFEETHGFTMTNLIERYDCDIFMHTWDEIDSSTLAWNNKLQYKKDISWDTVENIYKPKKLKIEHQEIKEDQIVASLDGSRKTSLNGMKFMFYSMEQANKLRHDYEQETGTKYDIVLCIRPDIAVYSFLDIENILFEANILGLDMTRTRFVSSVSRDNNYFLKLSIGQVNDMLFWGKRKVIDRYIASNMDLTYEYACGHMIAITTIFTSREIAAGILPVSMNFQYGKDWKNVLFDSTTPEQKSMK